MSNELDNKFKSTDVEILEELGYGMVGTVYKVKYKNKFYAMKIEHILDEEKNKDIKYSTWQEIDFMENFASQYSNQFIKMYAYEFVDNCTHSQKYTKNIENINQYLKNKFKTISQSSTCIKKYYELLDGSVEDLIKSLNKNQIYSFIIQTAIIVKILEKNGYVHGDLHCRNIGYIKTTQQFITYNNINIPTFGYIYKAIDFGTIMNNKYILNDFQTKNYNSLFKKELSKPLISLLVNFDNFYDYVGDNNIRLDYRRIKFFNKSNLSNDMFNLFKKIKEEYQFYIIKIFYPEHFQRLVLGKFYTKTFEPKLYIDGIDIIYLYEVDFDSDKIFNYFMNKIKDLSSMGRFIVKKASKKNSKKTSKKNFKKASRKNSKKASRKNSKRKSKKGSKRKSKK